MLKAAARNRARNAPQSGANAKSTGSEPSWRNSVAGSAGSRPTSFAGNEIRQTSVVSAQPEQEKLPTSEPTALENGGHHHGHDHHTLKKLGINPAIPHRKVKYIKHEGESGRSWFHPWHFIRIILLSHSTMSRFVNIFWPTVPAAIAVHFAAPEQHVAIFVLCYLAMIPSANLIGFAGQELARKLPLVFGVILETFLASAVEIVLFTTLIVKNAQDANDMSTETVPVTINVIRAAILGSILANLLLSLGFCFIAGGIRHKEQEFDEVVTEAGNGLLLVAGFALVIPAAFSASLPRSASEGAGATLLNSEGVLSNASQEDLVLNVSRATSVVLLIAWFVYMFYQLKTHHSLMSEVLEADEEKDHDRADDLARDKLTFTECILAITLGVTFVSLLAVFLVLEIEPIVERGVPDAFMGLILVPLVEKAAEHLAAVDEAWDNQANFALAHVMGASLQTALFNTPLVVFIGWGLGRPMDLDFQVYEAMVLILSIIVVGSFLRDGKSNYLEGVLCVLLYVVVAIAAYYFPDPQHESSGTPESGTGEHLARMLLMKR